VREEGKRAYGAVARRLRFARAVVFRQSQGEKKRDGLHKKGWRAFRGACGSGSGFPSKPYEEVDDSYTPKGWRRGGSTDWWASEQSRRGMGSKVAQLAARKLQSRLASQKGGPGGTGRSIRTDCKAKYVRHKAAQADKEDRKDDARGEGETTARPQSKAAMLDGQPSNGSMMGGMQQKFNPGRGSDCGGGGIAGALR